MPIKPRRQPISSTCLAIAILYTWKAEHNYAIRLQQRLKQEQLQQQLHQRQCLSLELEIDERVPRRVESMLWCSLSVRRRLHLATKEHEIVIGLIGRCLLRAIKLSQRGYLVFTDLDAFNSGAQRGNLFFWLLKSALRI